MSDTNTTVELPSREFVRNGKTIKYKAVENKKMPGQFYFIPDLKGLDVRDFVTFLGDRMSLKFLASRYRAQCLAYAKMATQDGELNMKTLESLVDKGLVLRPSKTELQEDLREANEALAELIQTDVTGFNVEQFHEFSRKVKEIGEEINRINRDIDARKRKTSEDEEDDES